MLLPYHFVFVFFRLLKKSVHSLMCFPKRHVFFPWFLCIVFSSYCMELPSSTYYLHAQYSLLVKRASLQRVVSLPDARYPCSLSCKRCPIPMMASVVCYSLKRSKIDLTRGQLRWDDFINSSCYEMKQYAFEECKKVDFRYDNTYY